MSDEQRVRRWWTEAFVIVVSILLAFAIDAAWDERQDTKAAEELARGLVDDIEESLVDLRYVRDFNSRGLEASLEARDVLRSPTPLISMDSLNALFVRSGAIVRLTPVSRSYDQLVATGLLRRLEPDVRAAIAEWFQTQEYVREYFEVDLLQFRQNVGFPFWVRSDVAFDAFVDGFAGLELGPPRFPHDWRSLHENQELNDILAIFATITHVTVIEYNELDSIGVALRHLLEARYSH